MIIEYCFTLRGFLIDKMRRIKMIRKVG